MVFDAFRGDRSLSVYSNLLNFRIFDNDTSEIPHYLYYTKIKMKSIREYPKG